MGKNNDIILYGALGLGVLYFAYRLGKPVEKLGNTVADVGGDVRTITKATGEGAAKILETTGTQSSNIVEGLGKTITNALELSQATTAAPLNFLQRLNKAYEDIAPIDWFKDRFITPLMR